MTATVFILDDDDAVRDSIALMVRGMGYKAVEFRDAESLMREGVDGQPGCLILDLRLGSSHGLDVLEKMPNAPVRLPVIVLTGHADVPSVIRAFRSGVSHLLEKPFDPAELQELICSSVRSNGLAWQNYLRVVDAQLRMSRMTPREREVANLIAAGNSNREIAQILGRSQKTIDVHRSAAMRKTESGNTADLVRLILTSQQSESRPIGLKLIPEDRKSQTVLTSRPTPDLISEYA